jgi:hypothetical protein
MITLPAGTRVWLAGGFTDMRKGFDGLAMLVHQGQVYGESATCAALANSTDSHAVGSTGAMHTPLRPTRRAQQGRHSCVSGVAPNRSKKDF